MTRPGRIVGLAASLLLVLFGARLGCRAVARSESERILDETRAAVLDAAAPLEPELVTRLREGFDRAAGELARDRLSPIARDTLRNRSEAVLADGRLNPAEARHLLRLLDDIPGWRDEVDARKYMGQR